MGVIDFFRIDFYETEKIYLNMSMHNLNNVTLLFDMIFRKVKKEKSLRKKVQEKIMVIYWSAHSSSFPFFVNIAQVKFQV